VVQKTVSSSRCHIAQNQPIFFIRWKIQRVEPNGLLVIDRVHRSEMCPCPVSKPDKRNHFVFSGGANDAPFWQEGGSFFCCHFEKPTTFYPLLPPSLLVWPCAHEPYNSALSTLSQLWANPKLPFVLLMSWLAVSVCSAQDSPSIARAAQLFGDGAGQDDQLR
jgi:hypothetical protein